MSEETAAIISEVFATHPDLNDSDPLLDYAYTDLHSLAVYHLLDDLLPDKEERNLRVAQWMLTIAKSEAARRTQEE